MTRQLFTGIWVLLLGGIPWFAAGCGSAPGDAYETFSTEDADRVDRAREERVAESAAEPTDETAEQTEKSAVVLVAARSAAAAITGDTDSPEPVAEQPADQQPAEPVADVNSSRPPAEISDRDDSAIDIAGRKAAAAVQSEPIVRTIKLLVPDRSFTVEGPEDAIRISYDDFDLLKVLNMEPVPTNAVDHFPKWLSDLDGKRVRLRGFMYPTFQETGIPAFVLARDNQICCFGRNPKIYDLVEVTLRDGVTTDYIQGRPFDVVGVFHIRPEADGDELWQLYQLDDAIIINE